MLRGSGSEKNAVHAFRFPISGRPMKRYSKRTCSPFVFLRLEMDVWNGRKKGRIQR